MITLNLLAKTPIPGQVKTRLIPQLGAAGAAAAHALLVTHAVGLARAWAAAAPERQLLLWCDPSPAHPLFSTLLPDPALRTLAGGDLGDKLLAISRAATAAGGAALLMGADAGSLQVADLEQADAALREHPATLAPTRDGGYLLLGIRSPAPELFSDMPWGGDQVAKLTRARLRQLGWSWHELPEQWDVDRFEEWQRFLEGEPSREKEWRRFHEQFGQPG